MIRPILLLVLFSFGCQKGAGDRLAEAREAMDSGDYAAAISSSSAGLEIAKDETTRWQLQVVHLEAQARSGDVKATLTALDGLVGKSVTSADFLSTADQLRAAGKPAGAVELLDRGLKRFPDDASLKKAIEQTKQSANDDEMEALRNLGYLD